MLGTKKLSEIKKELRQALKKTDEEFRSWLDREILEHGQSAQNTKVLEDLLWVQKMLRESIGAKKPAPKEQKKARKKKTSVA